MKIVTASSKVVLLAAMFATLPAMAAVTVNQPTEQYVKKAAPAARIPAPARSFSIGSMDWASVRWQPAAIATVADPKPVKPGRAHRFFEHISWAGNQLPTDPVLYTAMPYGPKFGN